MTSILRVGPDDREMEWKLRFRLRMIARKEQGYNAELETLHQGLISQSQREGRSSTKVKSRFKSLANVVNHDSRAERLKMVVLVFWRNTGRCSYQLPKRRFLGNLGLMVKQMKL